MVKIKEITDYLEHQAPLSYQESYDNSGLLIGDSSWEVTGVLLSLDCVEAVVDEAIATGCNLIIAHHPIWFSSLKRLTGNTYVEKTLIKAIKHDVALYAIHTNLDHVRSGVNQKFSQKLGLENLSILAPKRDIWEKLVVFVPKSHTATVLEALHQAGAGAIGDYDSCSFVSTGAGAFRPKAGAKPFLGKKGELEQVEEDRIEVVVPKPYQSAVIQKLYEAHPYEEVAYFLQPLANSDSTVGSGMVGYFKEALSPNDFLTHLKSIFGTPCIKYTENQGHTIQKVAVCGGAGSFLIRAARDQGCDALVTSDLKYHEYFDAENELLLADIGHYESEVATKELLSDILTKNFSTFAVRLSQIETNPIRYF